MNILIKLMSIVALIIAPHISQRPHTDAVSGKAEIKKEIKYEEGKNVVTETITEIKKVN